LPPPNPCRSAPRSEADIRLRRFDADGEPLGEEVRVETQPGRTFNPSLALAPDGRFAVAWDTYGQVWTRRFNADGKPAGLPWKVSSPGLPPDGFEGAADTLLDAAGNLLVTWTSSGRDGSDYGVYGKWYDASGAEKGGLFRLNTSTEFDQAGAKVAWQPGGFLAAWTSGRFNNPGQDLYQWDAIAQRFVIPPDGADPCVFGEDGLSCDLLHDGGNPESTTAFGQAGDLDGDGRDDACVRRGRRFACDTKHNGGFAEIQILFGRATDTALLGDVDGDGDDDPCVFRGDRFLCDTAHDGRGPEVGLLFGQPGDVPLLGDVDGDGRDDACVFRKDRFLCDTAHDGGAAEVRIRFGEASAIPLLGNVNGF
jgi:hypothetical protein